MERYRKSKTAKKLFLPAGTVLLVNLLQSYLKNSGIEIDDNIIWNSAIAGYGGVVALINYFKNRNKGKSEKQIKAV